MTSTDNLDNAVAFAACEKHKGDTRMVLHQALCACRTLVKEIDRLKGMETIVAKLPKCWRLDDTGKLVLDVPVTDGMTTWCSGQHPMPHYWEMRDKAGVSFRDHCVRQEETQYDSRAAAEAAKGGE